MILERPSIVERLLSGTPKRSVRQAVGVDANHSMREGINIVSKSYSPGFVTVDVSVVVPPGNR